MTLADTNHAMTVINGNEVFVLVKDTGKSPNVVELRLRNDGKTIIESSVVLYPDHEDKLDYTRATAAATQHKEKTEALSRKMPWSPYSNKRGFMFKGGVISPGNQRAEFILGGNKNAAEMYASLANSHCDHGPQVLDGVEVVSSVMAATRGLEYISPALDDLVEKKLISGAQRDTAKEALAAVAEEREVPVTFAGGMHVKANAVLSRPFPVAEPALA